MQDILMLVHRMPYPPNKGDKIRSWHLLRYLSQFYRIHLGTFIDDPDDKVHIETVQKVCADTHFVDLSPLAARLKSTQALFKGTPMTLSYYQEESMQQWVDRTMARHNIKGIMVYSSGMAQFVSQYDQVMRVLDFVDVDSEKWMQYSERESFPMSWIYRRESNLLLAYERQVAQEFDVSLFVSAAEAQLFKRHAPEVSHKVGYYSNGVDVDYFSPEREYPDPFPESHSPIVFTGAMDYRPNIDAVHFFAHEILPAIREQIDKATFYIVGARPTKEVQILGQMPGVYVTGSVPDIRPYLAHACFAVAPMQIARGIQNKVLEAMAMGKTIIVSPEALEGLNLEHKRDVLVARSHEQYFFEAMDLLKRNIADLGWQARNRVIEDYAWEKNLAGLRHIFDNAA